jgi:hypothetical protein
MVLGACRWIVVVLVAGVLGCAAAPDSVRSGRSPLRHSPSRWTSHRAYRVTASPFASSCSQPAALDATEPFDLYVMQLQRFQHAVFMTASGAWSPGPASLRQGLSVRGFAPVIAQWSEAPAGLHPVARHRLHEQRPIPLSRPTGSFVRCFAERRCGGGWPTHPTAGGRPGFWWAWVTQLDGHRCRAVSAEAAASVHFLTRPRSPEQYRFCVEPR